MDIQNLLFENLNNSFSIKLNNSEVLFIENLCNNSPAILNKIKDEIDNILKDDIIDLHDLPQIILLISDIYNNHIFENTIENIGIPNIVQFTLDSIIDSPILLQNVVLILNG